MKLLLFDPKQIMPNQTPGSHFVLIFIPKVKTKVNLVTQNRLLWILSGQVYQAPTNSFLNFYTDYKINKNSFYFAFAITK